MIRARFHANADDYRPIKWPVKYPYWCSGEGNDYSIVISYADSIAYIKEYWPEASEIEFTEEKEIIYCSRFPKPDWYKE